jgi:hypothetical protein
MNTEAIRDFLEISNAVALLHIRREELWAKLNIEEQQFITARGDWGTSRELIEENMKLLIKLKEEVDVDQV